MNYLKNNIIILKKLNHPNIIKFETIKKTKNYFYIVLEYCNGGKLFDALQLYKKKYVYPFSEEIIQYLMRQIIGAFKYIHGKKIVHGHINLDSIFINYDSQKDKEELNLMKAKAKIKEFGFSFKSVNFQINQNPNILYKINSSGTKEIELGNDKKSDIWGLGTLCYEMLIGESPFEEKDMNLLIDKIIEGTYFVPTILSKEIISFINNMLKNNSMSRLSIDKLLNHPFITNDIKSFHMIEVKKISNKYKEEELLNKTYKNKSIWSIFSEDDNKRLMNIDEIKCDNFRNSRKKFTSHEKIHFKKESLYNFLMSGENKNNLKRNPSPQIYNLAPAPSPID